MKRIFSSSGRALSISALLLLLPLTAHAVADDSSESRYRDNGDGTVTDLTTALIWQRCASNYRWNGERCELSTDRTDFNQTQQFAEASTVAGYEDWRLPTDDELRGLVYCSSGMPAFYLAATDAAQCEGVYTQPTIDRTYFQFDVNTIYWANGQEEIAGTASTVSFSSGQSVMRRATAKYATRLVRQGAVTPNLLQLTVDGTGAGIVEVGELSCSDECHVNLNDGEQVTLTAKPAPGSEFDGWGGSCSGTVSTCLVSAEERVNVSAQFSLNMAESRFKLHSDGTAYDPQAGLVWYRCVYGQQWVAGECDDNIQPGTYTEFETELNSLILAHQRNWRLPTKTELGSRIYCEVNGKLGVANTQACDWKGHSLYRDSVVSPQYWNFDLWTTTAGELDNSRVLFDGSGSWQTVDSSAEAFAVLVKDVPKNHAYLRFSFNGSGNGAIEFESQESCEDDCHRFAPDGSKLILTAQADANSEFLGWTGACSGSGTCELTAEDDQQVQAVFTEQANTSGGNNSDAPVTLDVKFLTPFAGMVAVQQGDMTSSCDTDCTHGVSDQAPMILTATALPGYKFVGWQGDCRGEEATCEVIAEQLQASDKFNVQPQFTVLLGTERYRWVNEQTIEDKATGLIWQRCAVGSVWREGACRETPEPMYANKAAGFADAAELDGADNWRLPTVSEMRTLIMCRDARSPRWPNQKGECATTFEALQLLDLSTFGWLPGSGHRYLAVMDDGSGYGRFNMFNGDIIDADLPGYLRLVRDPQPREREEQRLAITIGGATDSGSVSVQPQQLECVESCELSFETNQYIVLNATAAAGYQFDGWSGTCAGSAATCLVRMSEARSVFAGFVPQVSDARYIFHDDGKATDRWSGLTWQRCAYGQQWNDGRCQGVAQTVMLSEAQALQQNDWQLPSQAQLASLVYCASGQPSHWTQAQQTCSADTDSPTIKDGVLFGMDDSFKARPWSSTLRDDGSVAATIDFIHGTEYQQSSSRATVWLVKGEAVPLTVQTQGDGGVGVWVEPVNANCGVLCEYSLAKSSTVTLTVDAAANTSFSHWSGACSGSALTCQVTMSGAKSVAAHYDWKILSVTATEASNGSVNLSQTSVRYGDDLQFSVVPDYGYRVADVHACGAVSRNGSSYTVEHVIADCLIEATFEPVLYRVTTQTSEGVSITPEAADVVMGQSQVFNLTLAEGYELTSVTGCEGTLDGLAYTTAAVELDCKVVAEAEKKQYQVVFDLGEPATLVSGQLEQTVIHGDAAAVPEFTVARGWEFIGWSVSFDDVASDLTVVAQYQQVPILYFVNISAKGDGVLMPAGTHEVGEGQSLTINATAADGWNLASYVESSCGEGSWDGSAYTINAVSQDCAIEFSFNRPPQSGGALLLIMAIEAQSRRN